MALELVREKYYTESHEWIELSEDKTTGADTSLAPPYLPYLQSFVLEG